MKKEGNSLKSDMKIVAFQGSYRKSGITSTLLQNACSKLIAAGNEVEYINLHEKNIEYCKGCRKCLETKKCIYKADDMPEITEKIKAADILILAAPVYWANVPAVVKNLFDRLLGAAMEETDKFPKPRLLGKRYIFITACKTPMPFAKWCGQTTGIIRAVKEFFKTSGVKKAGIVICANSVNNEKLFEKKQKEIDRLLEKL